MAERILYTQLCRSYAGKGAAHRLYDQAIVKLLDWIAHFFGDSDRERPCWTAPAYDRCLLLAVIYPLVSMYLFWLMDEASLGDAQTALGFPEGLAGWRKAVTSFVAVLPLVVVG